MAHLKITNPPAAAAAFIFLSTPKAKAQPLAGAFFLFAPALVGCAWNLFVQWGVAQGIELHKQYRGAKPKPKGAKPPTVVIDFVNPHVETCVAQAVEGAAYVDDPLGFMIETLSRDRMRIEKQKRILRAMGSKAAAPLTKGKAAERMQKMWRRMRLVSKERASCKQDDGTSVPAIVKVQAAPAAEAVTDARLMV